MRRQHQGRPGSIRQLEDAKLLVAQRSRRGRRNRLHSRLRCGSAMDGGFCRRGRLDAKSGPRNLFEGCLHLPFVRGIGPCIAPWMFGPVPGIGYCHSLRHVRWHAHEGGCDLRRDTAGRFAPLQMRPIWIDCTRYRFDIALVCRFFRLAMLQRRPIGIRGRGAAGFRTGCRARIGRFVQCRPIGVRGRRGAG